MGAGKGTQKDHQNTKQLEKYLMNYIRTEMEKGMRKRMLTLSECGVALGSNFRCFARSGEVCFQTIPIVETLSITALQPVRSHATKKTICLLRQMAWLLIFERYIPFLYTISVKWNKFERKPLVAQRLNLNKVSSELGIGWVAIRVSLQNAEVVLEYVSFKNMFSI